MQPPDGTNPRSLASSFSLSEKWLPEKPDEHNPTGILTPGLKPRPLLPR